MSDSKQRFGLTALFTDISNTLRGFGKLHNAVSKGSLSGQLANTAVEPLVVIDRNLAHIPQLPDVLMAINELYASLYIQVAARLTALDIDAVRVTRTLEKLATNRDVLASLAGIESEKDFLSAAFKFSDKYNVGLEDEDEKTIVGVGSKDTSKMFGPVVDAPNLAVGRVVSLEFTQGKSSFVQPISIRLNPVLASSELIEDMFLANYTDRNIIRRIKLTHIGELTVKDALFGLDQVRRRERLMLKDPEGKIRNHYTEALKDAGFSVVTGEIPLNRASGILVISERGAQAMAKNIGGGVEKFRARQRLFEGTATTVIVVIDQDDGVVDIYLRDFNKGGSYTLRALERSGKSSNNNLEPMIKDLISGQIPSFR